MKSAYSILATFLVSIILSGCDSNTDTKVGQLIFWYDHDTSIALQTDGAESLTFYVDDKVVGSAAASVYATGQPECGQQGFVTVAMDLDGRSARSYSYKVVDQTDYEYWSGTVELKSSTCLAFELDW